MEINLKDTFLKPGMLLLLNQIREIFLKGVKKKHIQMVKFQNHLSQW